MIFRGPAIEIPEMSLTSFALRHRERLADRPALVEWQSGRALSFGQLAECVQLVAGGLAERGYKKGDVIALIDVNSIDYVIAFHAVATIGGIAAPINPQLSVVEMAHLLHETGATCVFTAPQLLDQVRQSATQTMVREFVVFGQSPGATAFASLLRSTGSLPKVAIDPRNDVVVVLCSSGTTGLPKAVQLTHHGVVATVCQILARCEIGEGEALTGHLPFFHIFGVGITLSLGLAQGAKCIVVPRFDLESFLQIVQDHRVRLAFLVPPVVVTLAKHPIVEQYDLSAFSSIICGAAPLGADVARACADRLGCRITQIYGMTETGGTHMMPSEAQFAKIGSVGPCTSNTECRVVDMETGTTCGPSQIGELWIRTPAMMKGYLNRPEETARTIDAEGWLHTGDIGYADEAGNFTIVDRLKELIKYNAYQVAPAELEAVLLSHPAVADAAVIPSPDELAGEVPKAFIVLKGEATADELMTFVAERVAPYKKIRRLEFIEAIPKSASGKILRRILVERERAAQPKPV